MIVLSKEKWKEIDEVNRRINSQVQYVSDPEQFGKPDFWEIVENQGDCDDYALTKRNELMKLGYSADDLRIATCWAEDEFGNPGQGEYHAVLVIYTDFGDYVLDNRYEEVMPWDQLPYDWHKIQGPDKFWKYIKD